MIYAVIFIMGCALFGFLMVTLSTPRGSCPDGAKLLEMFQVECATRLPIVNKCGVSGPELTPEETRLITIFVSAFTAIKEEMDLQEAGSVRDLKGDQAFGFLNMARTALFPDRFYRHYIKGLDRQQRTAARSFRADWQAACALADRLKAQQAA